MEGMLFLVLRRSGIIPHCLDQPNVQDRHGLQTVSVGRVG